MKLTGGEEMEGEGMKGCNRVMKDRGEMDGERSEIN
jgi:hypothetical protein